MGWMDFFKHKEKIENAKEELRAAANHNIHATQRNIQSTTKLWISLAASGNSSVNRLLKGMAK